MSSDNDIVFTHNLFALYMSGDFEDDDYRQNEMRTKNCYKNCVTFIIAI